MKIAFVAPYVPNKIRTRPYNLIRHLSGAGHEVYVFTVGSNSREQVEATTLEMQCRRVFFHRLPTWRSFLNCIVALPTRAPLQSVYSWDGHLARKLEEELRNGGPAFDIVHIEHLRGSRFGRLVMKQFPDLPVVWDSVDCISYLFEQAGRNNSTFFGKTITRFELGRTRHTEAELIRLFDHILTTSSADRNALLNLPSRGGEPSPISILPGGVDLEYFHPAPEIQPEPDSLVFSGKMSYHANIAMAMHLVEKIMPRIWQKRPNVRLYIVGKDPGPRITEFEKNPLIRVTGTVEDIRPYLWRAAVAVVPLVYGAGIQNKVLEAMACGTPVVTNSRALTALHATPEQHVLVGDDPDAFSGKILQLLENQDFQRKVGLAGLNYVREYHDWMRVASMLGDIYEKTIQSHKMSRLSLQPIL